MDMVVEDSGDPVSYLGHVIIDAQVQDACVAFGSVIIGFEVKGDIPLLAQFW